ncbi:unnamed protein product [Brassica rapa subsp. narinosa]
MNVRSRGKASWLLIYSKLCRRRLVAPLSQIFIQRESRAQAEINQF